MIKREPSPKHVITLPGSVRMGQGKGRTSTSFSAEADCLQCLGSDTTQHVDPSPLLHGPADNEYAGPPGIELIKLDMSAPSVFKADSGKTEITGSARSPKIMTIGDGTSILPRGWTAVKGVNIRTRGFRECTSA